MKERKNTPSLFKIKNKKVFLNAKRIVSHESLIGSTISSAR